MCQPTDICHPAAVWTPAAYGMQQVQSHADSAWYHRPMYSDNMPASDASGYPTAPSPWQSSLPADSSSFGAQPSLGVPLTLPPSLVALLPSQRVAPAPPLSAHVLADLLLPSSCMPLDDDDDLPSSPMSGGTPPPGLSSSDLKKWKRMMSNRASAKRSRKRRQERLEELEITSAQLQVENATTERRLEAVEAEAEQLRRENERLAQEIKRLKTEGPRPQQTRQQQQKPASSSHSQQQQQQQQHAGSAVSGSEELSGAAQPAAAPLAVRLSAGSRPAEYREAGAAKGEAAALQQAEEEEPILLDTPPRVEVVEALSGSEEEGLLSNPLMW